MKLKALKQLTEQLFEKAGVEDGDSGKLEMIFNHAFGFSRNTLLTEPDLEIDENSRQALLFKEDALRVARGEPVQHVVGYGWFYGRRFIVSKDCLIPRLETELLCERAISEISEKKKSQNNIKVLDLCTGSGAIGITVKKECPFTSVTLSDISEKAINIATKNASEILGSDKFVNIKKGSFLEPFYNLSQEDRFDFVLSNPPYIESAEIETLDNTVKNYDPILALDGGEDGLCAYKAIIKDLPKVMKDGGIIIFEIGYNQGKSVPKLLNAKKCFKNIQVIKDLDGIDRFVYAEFTDNTPKITLDSDISVINGVGPVAVKKFNSIGVKTVKDLILHTPIRYEDYSNITSLKDCVFLENNTPVTLKLTVKRYEGLYRNGKTISVFHCEDNTFIGKIVFFNAPYIRSAIHVGKTYYFHGKLTDGELVNPKYAEAGSSAEKDFLRLIPIYRSCEGLLQSTIKKSVSAVFSEINALPFDSIPKGVLAYLNIPDTLSCYRTLHNPDDPASLKLAEKRKTFSEILKIYMRLALLKTKRSELDGTGIAMDKVDFTPLYDLLPYSLTQGQQDTISQISQDMESSNPMNRLCIGDVGSGKTIIAVFAAYKAIKSGYQAAIMVPGTVLANQHARKISGFFEQLGISTGLLVGALSAKEKNTLHKALENGEIQCVIGTQALIQDKVIFKNLGLVVTDEQHRFGVNQRAKLSKGFGPTPHTLVMSATPIPRTLALVLYGDLDISLLKDKPGGRLPVKTFKRSYRDKNALYNRIRELALKGEQAFIVHSCIDNATDELGVNSAEAPKIVSVKDNFEKLSKTVFKGINTALLHGQLKEKEKQEVMNGFASGETKILFSTTVIEVGVDIPNANIMVIENAERFGLATLHQLRGRVGRNNSQAYCALLSDCPHGSPAEKRLDLMCNQNDGFEIAEKDLELRGPGEMLGTMQSGLSDIDALINSGLNYDMVKSAETVSKHIAAVLQGKEQPLHPSSKEEYENYYNEITEKLTAKLVL